MKMIKNKLRSRRGETLVETLVSITILGLSIGFMAMMVITSYNMTMEARNEDKVYSEELAAAEGLMQIEGSSATVKISKGDASAPVEIHVTINGTSEDGKALRSYSVAP